MGSPHRVHALPGGARLVTETMPERHSTTVLLLFGEGSRLEDERLAGVSHFIEHLFFKGTRRRPSPKEIADAIEGVGGFVNASTDKELTAYWARVPSEHMALGLDVLFDIVTNSRLDPTDVERERMVILEELRMYQDQPQDHVQNLFEELIWPGHPLGRDIAGTQESVSRLSRDEILEYADAHYRLPNLVIGAAGSINETEVMAVVSGVMAELRSLGETEVSAEDLARAKEFTKGRLRLELETTHGVAFWLTYQELLLGQIKTIEEELALVDAVSAADVKRVAVEMLAGPVQMSVIGPFARDSAFRLAIGA